MSSVVLSGARQRSMELGKARLSSEELRNFSGARWSSEEIGGALRKSVEFCGKRRELQGDLSESERSLVAVCRTQRGSAELNGGRRTLVDLGGVRRKSAELSGARRKLSKLGGVRWSSAELGGARGWWFRHRCLDQT